MYSPSVLYENWEADLLGTASVFCVGFGVIGPFNWAENESENAGDEFSLTSIIWSSLKPLFIGVTDHTIKVLRRKFYLLKIIL